MTTVRSRNPWLQVAGLLLLPMIAAPIAQDDPADPNITVDPVLFESLEYRSLGFTRGGRSTAVTGVPSEGDGPPRVRPAAAAGPARRLPAPHAPS